MVQLYDAVDAAWPLRRWLPHQLRTVALRELAGRIFIAIVNSGKTFTSIKNRTAVLVIKNKLDDTWAYLDFFF
jgi:hypothetical protein